MREEKVTVLIPAYNEESIIRRLVSDTLIVVGAYTKHFEVLVIDDGSTDRTFDELKKIKNKNLRIVQNRKNIGKTMTILHGFTLAQGSIVSFIDADYQYDPRDLPKVIEKVKNGADLCVGYREQRQDPVYRKFMSFFFNMFDRLLLGIKIRDVNSGLKAFRKESFKTITIRYLSARWFIDTEILSRYYHKNYKVEEVPIRHYRRGDGLSKVNCIKLALETIAYGFRLKYNLIFGPDS
ncbi:MAG: glycosyltransferase family 2 protein [Nanoarchaeota archaeon]